MAKPKTARWHRAGLPALPRLLALIMLVGLLAACAITPEPLTDDELARQSEEDIDRLFADTDPLSETEVLTLPRAIARALKYNLDHRIKMQEQALALGQLDVDKFELLPRLAAKTGYDSRSEYNASTNVDMVTGRVRDTPSYSSEKQTSTSDLTLSWNILDFGIGYYTAKQSADRLLIAAERRRKVLHSLIQEVFFSYWRAVAYQQLRDRTRETIRLAEQELANAEAEVQEKLTDPLQALRYQKLLLESIQKLESVERELSTAPIELAALINVEPGINIRVAAPEQENLTPPEWDMPLDRMEELAFHNNPDIRERSYQSRIAVQETRKAILRMLPGITLASANQYDSNDFLENNHWYEWSTRLTWNVFDMLRAPKRIEKAEINEKLVDMQRLALRMAVLAQVHVANHEFQDAYRKFKRADRFFQVSYRIADLVAIGRIGSQSARDSIYEKTSEILSRLQRYEAYANLQGAYGQLHATVGLDIAPPFVVSNDLEKVTMAVEERLLAWERGDLARQAMADGDLVDDGLMMTLDKVMDHCALGCPPAEAESLRVLGAGRNLPRRRPSLESTRALGLWRRSPGVSVEGYNPRNSLKIAISLATHLPVRPKAMFTGP